MTNLALAGTWQDITSNDLVVAACQDANVDYHETRQRGFLGSGTADIDFFHSDPLNAVVDIHDGATDIRMSSADTHDLDIGLFARIGGMSEISGCARIEGPLLTRMSFYGLLEQSVAAGPPGTEGGVRGRHRHQRHPDHVRLLCLRRLPPLRRAPGGRSLRLDVHLLPGLRDAQRGRRADRP